MSYLQSLVELLANLTWHSTKPTYHSVDGMDPALLRQDVHDLVVSLDVERRRKSYPKFFLVFRVFGRDSKVFHGTNVEELNLVGTGKNEKQLFKAF